MRALGVDVPYARVAPAQVCEAIHLEGQLLLLRVGVRVRVMVRVRVRVRVTVRVRE